MKNRINLESKYKVRISFDEISSVNDILVSYYLPIIGNDAYSLYSIFIIDSRNNIINSIFISVNRIISMLNISLENIDDVLKKLEVVNLIKIYNDKNNNFIFTLYEPLSPKEFNNNFQLKELFINKVGKYNIDINNKLFNSMKFNEFNNNFKLSTKVVDGSKKNIKLNVKYNFDNIKKILTSSNIDWTIFWNEELENKILDYSIVFEISDLDLSLSIIDQINELGNLNLQTIFSNFKLDKNLQDIKSIIDSNENEQEIKLDYMKNLKSKNFIIIKLNRKPTNEEIKLITNLSTKFNLNDYMINILIDFSILVNEGAIISKYILKIADTLIKQNINDADNLIKHLKTSYKLKINGKIKNQFNVSTKKLDGFEEF